MDINVVLFHMLSVNENYLECGMFFFIYLKLCSIYIYILGVPNVVFSL